MSTLGRQALIDRMRAGTLRVSPILTAHQIGGASIDLRMGNVVLMVRARGTSHVDPAAAKRNGAESSHTRELDLQQKHERYELPFRQKFLLHPGSLALVPTLEWVALPPDLVGMVTARSTWAREGLSIATATLIQPSYRGIVTLELANLGQIPIALYPGMEIAQIAFATIVGEAEQVNPGQFSLSFEPRQGTLVKASEEAFIPSS